MFFNNLLCKKYLTALNVSSAKKACGPGLFSVPALLAVLESVQNFHRARFFPLKSKSIAPAAASHSAPILGGVYFSFLSLL
jgi:hypothetical protein